VVEIDKPAMRVTYRLAERGSPTLVDVLTEHGLIEAAAPV
jgi:hypothetical protein